jgi:hydroxymethylpyrimidine pyrophosphatase-like HAD family hydrolase
MIAIDFDGTIARYDGVTSPDDLGEPIPGAIEFLRALHKAGYTLAIFSARATDPIGKRAIEQWVAKHDLDGIIEFVTYEKLVDFELLIDDRAIRFEGDYRDTLKQVLRAGRRKSEKE